MIRKKCSDVNLGVDMTVDIKEGHRHYPLTFNLNDLLQKGSIMGLSDQYCVLPVIGADNHSRNVELGTLFLEKYYVTIDMSPVIERGDKYTIVGLA